MLKLGSREMKGKIWDEGGKTDILQILISHQQNCINSIQFLYYSNGGTLSEPNGSKFHTVVIDQSSEFLTSVSGAYEHGRLVSLVFVTNKRTFGPFGKVDGGPDEFNYNFAPICGYQRMCCFGGFHGSVYNGSVYGIGVYVKPLVVVAPKRHFDDDLGLVEGFDF